MGRLGRQLQYALPLVIAFFNQYLSAAVQSVLDGVRPVVVGPIDLVPRVVSDGRLEQTLLCLVVLPSLLYLLVELAVR